MSMSTFLSSPEFYNLTAYYDVVVANLTWYQLNSEYKDPMYQYMRKLYLELFDKVKAPLQSKIYTIVDDFVVSNINATLNYGSYECSAPGKEAYMESWFSCLLFQIPFFLEKIQLGYIGFVFLLPIMLISIFGGIKESYKWFILNQAIWDVFLCYDFICARPTMLGWSDINIYLKQNTCFYRRIDAEIGTFSFLLKEGFRGFLRNGSFIPVFHLAFSRYICMYFPGFYKKLTKGGYKILIFILLFNLICLTIFCVAYLTFVASVNSVIEDLLKCNEFCPSLNNTYCNENVPKYFQCLNRILLGPSISPPSQQRLQKIFRYISYSIPPIMFLLSIICVGFLFSKIASQLKFQLKTNRESFKQTIKISSVVGFQCLTMSVIFVITGVQKYMKIQNEMISGGPTPLYDELPIWLYLLQNYTTTASFNMVRIILDSCIVLTVLSGYSSCIISTIKFLLLCMTNPKQAFKKIKHNMTSTTKVTVIPSSQK